MAKVFNLEGPVINDASIFSSFYNGKKITSSSVDQITDYLEEDEENKAYIKMSSPGGDVMEAKIIVSKLQPYQERIDVEIVGFAASAGSYIPLASANKIFMREGSLIMNHEPMIRSMKPMNRYELKKEIEVLDLIAENLIEVIANKTEKDVEEVRETLKSDKYYDAKKAKEEGLVDEILEKNENTKSALEKYKAEYENFDKIYLNFAKEIINSKVTVDEVLEEESEEEVQEEILNTDEKKLYDSKLEGYLNEIKELKREVQKLQKDKSEWLQEKKTFIETMNERAIKNALDRGAILPIEEEYYRNEFKNAQYESTQDQIRETLNNKRSSDYFTLSSKPFSENDINSVDVGDRNDYKQLGLSDDEILRVEKLKREHNFEENLAKEIK